MTPSRFQDRFLFFSNQPQQQTAVAMLYSEIEALPGGESILSEDASWAVEFSNTPAPPPAPAAPATPSGAIHLDVPWFWQRDNDSGQGDRECFSSSLAMIAAFWGKVGSDSEYNQIRRRFGDTTSSCAQLSTMRYLGFTANFHTSGRNEDLMRELQEGRPVGVGWLHHGHVSRPSGGGHWSTVVGAEGAERWIVHDPFGRPDLVNGGWIDCSHNAGRDLRFTRANFGARWMVEGNGTGWYFTARP